MLKYLKMRVRAVLPRPRRVPRPLDTCWCVFTDASFKYALRIGISGVLATVLARSGPGPVACYVQVGKNNRSVEGSFLHDFFEMSISARARQRTVQSWYLPRKSFAFETRKLPNSIIVLNKRPHQRHYA